MFLFSRRPFFSCSSFSSLEMENKVTVRRSFSSGADCKLLRQTHKNRIMQRVFFVRFVREIFVFISFFVLNGGRKDSFLFCLRENTISWDTFFRFVNGCSVVLWIVGNWSGISRVWIGVLFELTQSISICPLFCRAEMMMRWRIWYM